MTIFVFKTTININYILRLYLIANFNAQWIIINNKIFDTSIALLDIYNKKNKSLKLNNYIINRILTKFQLKNTILFILVEDLNAYYL